MKRALAVLLVVLGGTTFVSAKGVTTKIRITGARLETPIEITDPDSLKNFNVWAGPGTFVNGVEGTDGFIIDWASGAVAEPPTRLNRYEVLFYVKYENRPASEQEDHLAYAVLYQTDASSGQSYVYLPGRGDEAYPLNTRAILRGREGSWFRPSATWRNVADRLLAQAH
ncbi:MAG: hypothetical protein DMF89_08735 [Acidobacteria bacterium]|nr:MAG: hypothetical protein DMF90_14080 [Acidobacteriota bacterium]PYR50580.1 MAG: hypothetical protein DMF89_08735 [Acidobacteriota bacterium]